MWMLLMTRLLQKTKATRSRVFSLCQPDNRYGGDSWCFSLREQGIGTCYHRCTVKLTFTVVLYNIPTYSFDVRCKIIPNAWELKLNFKASRRFCNVLTVVRFEVGVWNGTAETQEHSIKCIHDGTKWVRYDYYNIPDWLWMKYGIPLHLKQRIV